MGCTTTCQHRCTQAAAVLRLHCAAHLAVQGFGLVGRELVGLGFELHCAAHLQGTDVAPYLASYRGLGWLELPASGAALTPGGRCETDQRQHEMAQQLALVGYVSVKVALIVH